MSIKEGTRRLALLLGCLGAISGGLLSYSTWAFLIKQRAEHLLFEHFANLPEVQQERNCRLGVLTRNGCPEPPTAGSWDEYRVSGAYPNSIRVKVTNSESWDFPKEMTNQQIEAVLQKRFPSGNWTPPFNDGADRAQGQKSGSDSATDPWNQAALDYRRLHSQLNFAGVKTIEWSPEFSIKSIQASDGQTLYPTPAPSALRYLSALILPFVGFLVPWGMVRAISWTLRGFTEHSL